MRNRPHPGPLPRGEGEERGGGGESGVDEAGVW